ncbi:hypothetical protein AVEN_15955-1 [Araneus ventricosus]|uniref:Uncharacterized protein n=1 Tax=Araneus ventricosus TaxID=182803 RepID=A0A4Y2S4T5_ARAVE|nr:hypothetical protein AVEN_15955-1 [Araneus ventricosus]
MVKEGGNIDGSRKLSKKKIIHYTVGVRPFVMVISKLIMTKISKVDVSDMKVFEPLKSFTQLSEERSAKVSGINMEGIFKSDDDLKVLQELSVSIFYPKSQTKWKNNEEEDDDKDPSHLIG